MPSRLQPVSPATVIGHRRPLCHCRLYALLCCTLLTGRAHAHPMPPDMTVTQLHRDAQIQAGDEPWLGLHSLMGCYWLIQEFMGH
jgi:hypothetical protein